jgi:hypothetical protein
VKKYSYFREQQDVLTQFVAAFDDCFVYRYDKNFNAKEKINVRYVFGPKQRVLYDIVNPAKNITLPVVSIEQINVKRDANRVQFKDQKITRPNFGDTRNITKVPTPVPVSFDLNVSIVCNYKEDIDQIVSNFIPWCNPYFIISWRVPEEFGMNFIDELRTEVSWSGTVEYEHPTNIEHSDKYKIVGNTSFNVKGWIFPAFEAPQAPIYVIDTNFITVPTGDSLRGYESYPSLSANDATDVILISAYPEFTNYFVNGILYTNLEIGNVNDNTYSFYGKRFGFNNTWYISSNNVIPELNYVEVDTAKFPTISAYQLPESVVTTVNDNIVTITLSSNYLSLSSDFKFITRNDAGWGETSIFYIV